MSIENHELSLMFVKPNVFHHSILPQIVILFFIFRAHIYLYHQSSITFYFSHDLACFTDILNTFSLTASLLCLYKYLHIQNIRHIL